MNFLHFSNMFLICLYFVLCASGAASGRVLVATDVKGYYWRDFTGVIPSDALPGGEDVSRKPIYIGQVLHNTHLIPAQIYYNDDKAYFEYDGAEHTTSQNIKILCTQHADQFEWIDTNNDDIKLITDKHLIIGGYDQPKSTTYIGRVRAGGEVAVGKIIAGLNSQTDGLHVTVNGHKEHHTSYQVLATP